MVSSSFQLYARALLIEFETRHCIVKSFANFRSERLVLFARVKWENSWCWRLQYLRNDNNYRDVGCHRFVAWLLHLPKSENGIRISLTISEIFDRKREPWTRYFFISRANSFERVLISLARTGQHSEVLMLTTSYLRNDMNDRNVVCTVG